MSRHVKTRQRVEFGDFQTPRDLALQVCQSLATRIPAPAAIIEPTCGLGGFLLAAHELFPQPATLFGMEINASHVQAAQSALQNRSPDAPWEIRQDDFFKADWKSIVSQLPEPLLVIGNPPWVTNSGLGVLDSSNVPRKCNERNYSGLDALTGKSNFDISEWMLLHLIGILQGRSAVMAMLCKTAIARKVLIHAWKNQWLADSEIRLIDAKKHFGVAVDACLLVCSIAPTESVERAPVFPSISATHPSQTIGVRDGRLVADLRVYDATSHFRGDGSSRWRSGIKHDCAAVMELVRVGQHFQNGMGDLIELEDQYVFPMLKSSDLARGRTKAPRRWMLVTQRGVGDPTSTIESDAPLTWRYLQRHADKLDRRGSSIYRGRPRFSVFGVGEYSFAPHKVATSGLYKHLAFTNLGPFQGKPMVLDDTCAMLPCRTEEEGVFVARLLSSEQAHRFYSCRIFWDSKRPVTTERLNELDLHQLAMEIAPDHPVTQMWSAERDHLAQGQLALF